MILGLVSTLGAGIVAASTAARARVTGSTTGSGAARWPSGSHTHCLSAVDSSDSWSRPSLVDISHFASYHTPLPSSAWAA